jgi:hypothetical protein
LLANQFLGLNDATSIARTLSRVRARGPSLSLSPFRLALVSNATTDFLKPMLMASALRYGVLLEILEADFGQAMQEAIDPASSINVAKPDAVLLAIDYRGLPFRSPGTPSGLHGTLTRRWRNCRRFAMGSGHTVGRRAWCKRFQRHSI